MFPTRRGRQKAKGQGVKYIWPRKSVFPAVLPILCYNVQAWKLDAIGTVSTHFDQYGTCIGEHNPKLPRTWLVFSLV